jgi:hypothetical protein
MIKINNILVILCCFCISECGFCQTQTFNWDDTTFNIGASKQVVILRNFDGPPCPNQPCYEYAENSKIYDTIINFLQVNPKIKIEIAWHTDQRGSEEYNQKYSEYMARAIKDELVEKGIESSRIESKGFGESKPIIGEETINELKTDKEKNEAYPKNRRIEIIIIKN